MLTPTVYQLETYLFIYNPIYDFFKNSHLYQPRAFWEYYLRIPDLVLHKLSKNGGNIDNIDCLLEHIEIFVLLLRLQFPEIEKYVNNTHLYYQNKIEIVPELNNLDSYSRSRWNLMYNMTQLSTNGIRN